MTADFPTLIGRFIHHCGALGLFINNSISAFATDPLLPRDAIQSTLYRRIVLLRQLLLERPDIKREDIYSLCNELDEIRKQRSIVVHNPIMSTMPNEGGTEVILVLRHKPAGVTSPDKITKEDVAKLIQQTNQLMLRFVELIPAATGT
jgi:hypothetical protein